MNYQNRLSDFFVISFAISLMLLVACSHNQPIDATQKASVATETVIQVLATQEIKLTTITSATEPTATLVSTQNSSPLPSPLPTVVTTPSPTISPLQKLGELPVAGYPSPNLEVTADESLLAISAGGMEDVLYVFDMTTQTIKWELKEENTGGTTGYSSLVFSPDGRYLAAWDNGYSLFVWDAENGEIIFQKKFDRDENIDIDSISFSPTGELLAFSSHNSPVNIYNMTTGDFVDTFPSPNILTYPDTENNNHFLKPNNHYGEIWEVKFVPNYPNRLAFTILPDPFVEGEGVSGGLYFWDMEEQSLQSVLLGSYGLSIVVSPDGQLLVARIGEKIVGWNLLNNYESFAIENIENDTYLSAITDAGLFATLSQAEGMKIWNFSGELIGTLSSDKTISDMIFMTDGRLLVTYIGDDNQPIEVWEIRP